MNRYDHRSSQQRRRPSPDRRRMRARRVQKQRRRLVWILSGATALAVVLALVIALIGAQNARHDNTPALSLLDHAATATAQAIQTPQPEATEVPEATAQPETTQPAGDFVYDEAYVQAVRGDSSGALITPDYSKVDPNKLGRWPQTAENTMPVLYRANTDENIIAITVDDCYQAQNLQRIVQCALDNSAQLTIFPIGSNIARAETASVVKWAWENGMEIENHTYSHEGLYHYDDERMTDEIWRQSQQLNQVPVVHAKTGRFN